MHRDKTAARILLILHVVHLAVARRPAIVRQRSLDVDEDVIAALEKRGNSDETPQDSYPVPQIGNELPTTSGISRDDPPPESGTAQLHNDQPQTSGPSPSQDNTLPASEDSQSHNGPPAGSNDPQLHDAPSQSRPPSDLSDGDSVHGESLSNSPQELDPVPQMNNDRPPASGAPQLENDPRPASGTLPVHDDLRNAEGAPSSHGETYSSYESETPPPHTPEANGVPADLWKTNLKIIGILGTFTFVSTAVLVGGSQWYKATHKPQPNDDDDSKTYIPIQPIDNVVGRDVSTHPRLPKKPVSRALAILRDEDSRLLSVLTRRVLERLD